MYQKINQVAGLVSVDKSSGLAVYVQIANDIAQAIRNGNLRRETKLPGARSLAEALGVHRKTLQTALDELVAQGWLEIVPRRGTFVARDLPELKPLKIIPGVVADEYPDKTNFPIRKKPVFPFPPPDFQNTNRLVLQEGFPDLRLAPLGKLMREIRSLEKRGNFRKYFHYGSPNGITYFRDTLAAFLADTRNLAISRENLLVTKGAQMGIYIAAHALLSPGDNVVVGEPGYVTATLTLKSAGGVINRIKVDENGIDVDAIEALCKRKKIRLVYVIPHHHHPTTVTLTPERRIRLLDLAARYKFAIIEDDYDYDFHYNSSPMLPMASLDQHGNVIYIGTLSKTLVPALRLGFMVAPANFIDHAASLRRSIDFQGDSIMEAAVAELYRNGTVANHIKKVVKIYEERRNNFCALLRDRLCDHISFNEPPGGMGVWTTFLHADLQKVTAKAAALGVTMSDGAIYNTFRNYRSTRLGFTSLNFQEQEKAIEVLRKCVLA